MSATNDKKVVINKRLKGLSREALEKLTQTELIDKVIQLEAYNFQLRNLLQKKLSEKDKHDKEYSGLIGNEAEGKVSQVAKISSKVQKIRKFDWSRYVVEPFPDWIKLHDSIFSVHTSVMSCLRLPTLVGIIKDLPARRIPMILSVGSEHKSYRFLLNLLLCHRIQLVPRSSSYLPHRISRHFQLSPLWTHRQGGERLLPGYLHRSAQQASARIPAGSHSAFLRD